MRSLYISDEQRSSVCVRYGQGIRLSTSTVMRWGEQGIQAEYEYGYEMGRAGYKAEYEYGYDSCELNLIHVRFIITSINYSTRALNKRYHGTCCLRIGDECTWGTCINKNSVQHHLSGCVLSRSYTVQVVHCPGCVLSRMCAVQVVYCPRRVLSRLCVV